MRLISALTGIAFVTSIAMASSAFAQSDCTKTVPPSPFGKDDQTGATNRITPAVTKAAAAEIKEGKVISLTNPLVDGVPLFGSRFTKTILTAATSAHTSMAWDTLEEATATTTRLPWARISTRTT